jgi:CheY-like chemotaxis protein
VATKAEPATQAKLHVKDDVMIRMVLADMLCELGYTVAAEAASIDEALEATRKTDFDLAILDADLKGRVCLAVADALVARHMVGLRHGLWRRRVARLSRPADPEEAIPDRRAKARVARAPWGQGSH